MKKLVALGLGLFLVSLAQAEAPLRIGEDVIKQFQTRHPYVRAEGTRPEVVWTETLSYPGAAYIAVHFQQFSLAPGDVVIVRSPDGRQSASYEGLGRGKLGMTPDGFWARHVKGDRAVVELISQGRGASDYGFVIDRFARGYRREEMEAMGMLAPESICGPDNAQPAKCFDGPEPLIYDRSRAIARLLSGGSAFCTGWLVGNAGHIMTNEHCISTNAAAVNTDYEFMAQGATCGTVCGPDACPGTIVDGASLVQVDAQLDYSLILLAANASNTYGFLKLRTTGAVADERIYIVGHPNGEGKQVAALSTEAANPSGFCELDQTSITPCVGGSPFPDIGYHCDTEPGSSGSAVLAYSDHKVVALHHCGGCPNTGLDIVDVIADLSGAGNLPPGSTFDPAGRVTLDQAAYGCSQTINIEVRDDNLIGAGTQAVAIDSTTEGTDESVLLTESPAGSGRFAGSIDTTTASPVTGDGLLSVTNADTIVVTYIDADDGAGGINVPRTDTAAVDCVGPVISNVQITDIQGTTAIARWTTNEASDSEADYGFQSSPPPTQTASSAAKVTNHALLLTGLVACNDYIVRVRSTDAQGNTTSDDNGGVYYQFNSGVGDMPTYAASNTPVPIPASSAIPNIATIQVPDNKVIVDVNVKINITHTYDGDMVISLRHPDGTLVLLSNRRGVSGDNFTNTIFNDQATTPIASGAAPFTGSYIPDGPLSALNGKIALGEWKLEVLDNISGDSGTINSAEITFVFPTQSCGPDADFEDDDFLADACSSGGPGSGNGFWDDGEEATIRVHIRNTGTTSLTGVSATLTSLTAGVTLVDDSATYADLAPGTAGPSQAPDFRAKLAEGFACGDPISFSIQITTNEGSYGDTFVLSVAAGEQLPGSGTILFENFAAGIPGTWSVVDGGAGGGAAATWTTANPGARVPNAPISNPFAIVDSDNAGTAGTQDESLITPVLDLSSATSVTLEFDQFFRWYSLGGAEKGDVDVRSTATGGAWVNVFRNQGGSSADPDHRVVNITASAAGAADVQVRFRYYDGSFEWFWMVDNVRVTYSGVGGCNLVSCDSLAPPGEVAATYWPTDEMLAWDGVAEATSYNVYRGRDIDLPKLFTGDTDSCLYGTAASNAMPGIAASPSAGEFDWWLVRAANGAGEGPPGASTAGPRVHDSSGVCP